MSQNKGQNGHHKKNILEYIVFWTSLVLIASLLTYLTYTTIAVESSPPILQIEFQQQPTEVNPYLFRLLIFNQGIETAEEVEVELMLEKDGKIMESSKMKLDFVPGESRREVWMNFSKDPELADTIYARVVSYKSS